VNISALMLTTKDRWFFTGLAIESWLDQRDRQPDDELVIVSEDDIPGLGQFDEGSPNIRFVDAPAALELAEKRNLGVDACRNPLVLFWDDDDWHGPERLQTTRFHAGISVSYRHVVDRGSTIAHELPQIVGQREALFHELIGEGRTFLYQYPLAAMQKDPFFVGGTLAFRKELWEKHPFVEKETRGDEGWWMVERMRDEGVTFGPILRTDATTYVAMIHGKNYMTHQPRVNRHGEVLSNSYMKLLTSNPAAQLRLCISDERLARYHAAVYAQSGEQE
jgi:hypothetical protein